jgi:hypothetical protein
MVVKKVLEMVIPAVINHFLYRKLRTLWSLSTWLVGLGKDLKKNFVQYKKMQARHNYSGKISSPFLFIEKNLNFCGAQLCEWYLLILLFYCVSSL